MASQVHKNILWSYVNRLVNLPGVLILVPIYIRFLGRRLYGEWLVIMTVGNYLALANIGIDQTLTNRIAEAVAKKCRPEVRTLISTSFFAYGAIAAVLAAAFAILSSRLSRLFMAGSDDQGSLALFLASALCALALPWNTYFAALRGFERMDQEQVVSACTSLSRNVGLVVAVISGLKLVPLALIQGAATLLRGPTAYVCSLRMVGDARPHLSAFSAATLRSLIRPSFGFFVLQVAGVVGFGIDNLVIGYALGPEAVTRYAVPYSLVMMAAAFFATAIAAVMPTITLKFAQAKKRELASALILAIKVALSYAAVGTIFLTLAGPRVLVLWAGRDAFPGILTFRLQILLLLVQAPLAAPHAVLMATTRHSGAAVIHIVESALNLLLSLRWVHTWGLPGVIAGTLVARLLTSAWYLPVAAAMTLELRVVTMARLLTFVFVLCGVPVLLIAFAPDRGLIHLEVARAVTAAIVFGALFFLLGLTTAERGLLTQKLKLLSGA
jgi:O-antigen/teichoic acid export membrane protein